MYTLSGRETNLFSKALVIKGDLSGRLSLTYGSLRLYLKSSSSISFLYCIDGMFCRVATFHRLSCVSLGLLNARGSIANSCLRYT